jgi:hypothetical protein
MKPHFIVLGLIACGAGLSTLDAWTAQPEQRVAAAPIDFVALQQQADAALDHLRRAQQSHQPPAAAAEQRYSLLMSSK